MTQEEKVKRYDKAFKEAEKIHKFSSDIAEIKRMEQIFPELKESEDEKIRKELISFLQLPHPQFVGERKQEKWIAWLEKQGERKPYGQRKECLDCQFNYAGECKGSCAIKRNEQNLADKIEPKFHEGDWIISNTANEDYRICKITDINNGYYTIESIYGYKGYNQFNVFEESYRLWNIQDAKDGDVLAEDSCIFIIQKYGDNTTEAKTYYTLYDDGDFDDGTILYFDIDSTKPATKEQRDMLFQKMHEAGYTFDFEKKELKKLKFRVGDEVITENEESLTITRIDEEGYWSNDLFICNFDDECIWDLVEQKPADKVEPKFKVGDNIRRKTPSSCDKDMQVARIEKDYYVCNHIGKFSSEVIPFSKESSYEIIGQKPVEWRQENREELTEFENAMMHIGGSFFGENAGLDPNDTATIKEQAKLLLELAPKTEWSEEDEKFFKTALWHISYSISNGESTDIRCDTTEWFKSIKNRIKGE